MCRHSTRSKDPAACSQCREATGERVPLHRLEPAHVTPMVWASAMRARRTLTRDDFYSRMRSQGRTWST